MDHCIYTFFPDSSLDLLWRPVSHFQKDPIKMLLSFSHFQLQICFYQKITRACCGIPLKHPHLPLEYASVITAITPFVIYVPQLPCSLLLLVAKPQPDHGVPPSPRACCLPHWHTVLQGRSQFFWRDGLGSQKGKEPSQA